MYQPKTRALVYSADISSTAGDVNGNWDAIRNCRYAQDAVAAESIEDMITKLEGLGGPYKFITVCGHAAEGNQSIGGTYDVGKKAKGEYVIRSTDDYQPNYDLVAGHLQDVAPLLGRLSNIMENGGVLFLGGCDIAAKQAGRNLLKELSALIPQVWIVGSTCETTEQVMKKKAYVEVAKASENGKFLGSITWTDILVARAGKIKKTLTSISIEEMLEGMTQWKTA